MDLLTITAGAAMAAVIGKETLVEKSTNVISPKCTLKIVKELRRLVSRKSLIWSLLTKFGPR